MKNKISIPIYFSLHPCTNVRKIYINISIFSQNRERYILTIGTEGKSWWLEHGIGCKVTNSSWENEEVDPETGRNSPPEAYVAGCILQYYYVEVIHAAVQCLLSVSMSSVATLSSFLFLRLCSPENGMPSVVITVTSCINAICHDYSNLLYQGHLSCLQ